ncbi:MAG TPA: MFS transporter [Victivallales bacterium]|nr:MFS transporter [Victivallales bacterium]
MIKNRMSSGKISIMNLGFLGQNFSWGVCFGVMSAIFEYLGARPDQIAGLWLAGPVTGIIMQLIAGKWSDWTWNRFGRRRPFILVGSILVSVSFIGMIFAGSLYIVVILFWLIMGANNAMQGPYRTMIADILPSEQVPFGFIIQYIFCGLGTTVAYFTPWLLLHLAGVSTVTQQGTIPLIVKLSFLIGSVILLLTNVISCIFTKEYPPENMEIFRERRKKELNIFRASTEIFVGIIKMPKLMRQVAISMFISWIGIFLMLIYFTPAVATNIFGAHPGTTLYTNGVVWAGFCFAMYSIFSIIFSFCVPFLYKFIELKNIFAFTIAIGGVSLISLLFISDHNFLIIPMIGVGIMYAGNQSIPFAIIGEYFKDKDTGTNMGIFHTSGVFAQVLVSIFFGYFLVNFLGNNALYAVVTGGVFLLIASVSALFIQYKTPRAKMDS